ncbi:MAG: septation protein A [Gammaproteobacteria bacterium]|nr:septation protein A [Gammaproteobacteria bacterium]
MKLLFDFFPILLFFIAYKLWGIYAATAVAIVASIAQVSVHWWRHRRVENMHLVTLALVVVLGGLTLLLQDERFIMWKPTLVNWLFALAFLGSRFVGEKTLVQRMMGSQIVLPRPIWNRLNWSWVVFFLLLGAANVYVAFYYGLDLSADERRDIWVNFKLFGMMGLTFAFVIAQAFYLARHMRDDEKPQQETK